MNFSVKHQSQRLKIFVLIFLSAASFITGQPVKTGKTVIAELVLGKSIKREISGGETHAFNIRLKSQQFVHAVAYQEGIDLVVKVFNPKGEQIDEIDNPYPGVEGPEKISLESNMAGVYRIEIQPFCPQANRGTYYLYLTKLQAAATTKEGKVDQLYAYWDNKDSPGAAIAVVKDGKIVFKKGYGMANFEYDIPNTPSTLFYICSESKQFTAFAIASLAVQGKIDLEADVREYLPEMPDFGESIKVKHLIYHTSGLREITDLLHLAGWRRDYSYQDILKLYRHQQRLNFTPGGSYLYCNTGYVLLALIVERLTGLSINDWSQKHVFKPLGMTNTRYYDDPTKISKNRAHAYSPGHSGGYAQSILDDASLVGAGGILSTIEDLSKWTIYLENLKDSHPDLLAVYDEQGVLNSGKKLDYAFGHVISKHRGLRIIEHGGASGTGFKTLITRIPGQRFSIIQLSNYEHFYPSEYTGKIIDIYLAEQLKSGPERRMPAPGRKAVSIDLQVLDDYTGTYKHWSGMTCVVITKEGNQLMLQQIGEPKMRLYPESETKFFLRGYDFQFSFPRNKSGEVTIMIAHQFGQDNPLKRTESLTLDLDQLREYTGNFYCSELDTTYSLAVKEDGLTAQHRLNHDVLLTRINKDIFKGNREYFQSVTFMRDKEKVITAFTISNGRAMNIRFDRIEPPSQKTQNE